ncbi:DUF2273 domain-containing protein [Aquipuribacter sp. MA13-6]|uniref:DUF2273 domain-containing protein n=1 Tax=unclassified Aquipuribacter TaxID=2635084 RepID=UPI003EE9986D
MTTSHIGLLAGILLALAATTGGFTGFLLALVLGAVGYGLGAWRDGDISPSSFSRGRPRA